jgi:hypothetical protein
MPRKVFRLQARDQASMPGSDRAGSPAATAAFTAFTAAFTAFTAAFTAFAAACTEKTGPEGPASVGVGIAVKGWASPGILTPAAAFPATSAVSAIIYYRFRFTSSSSRLSLTVITRALAW